MSKQIKDKSKPYQITRKEKSELMSSAGYKVKDSPAQLSDLPPMDSLPVFLREKTAGDGTRQQYCAVTPLIVLLPPPFHCADVYETTIKTTKLLSVVY